MRWSQRDVAHALRHGGARPVAAAVHALAQDAGTRLSQSHPRRIDNADHLCLRHQPCAGHHGLGRCRARAAEGAHLRRASSGCAGELDASDTDTLIVLTSEHWANFFLDHIGAFCVGRAERYSGPVEPWLKIPKAPRSRAIRRLRPRSWRPATTSSIEPSFAYELEFDHGTMLPLHFLMPKMDRPIVPVFFNTLAAPQPTARRALALRPHHRRSGAALAAPHRPGRDRRPLARSGRAQPRHHRFRLRPPLHGRDGGGQLRDARRATGAPSWRPRAPAPSSC